jgi:hypothetical protein
LRERIEVQLSPTQRKIDIPRPNATFEKDAESFQSAGEGSDVPTTHGGSKTPYKVFAAD